MSLTSFFSLKNIVETFSLFDINGYPFIMVVWNILLAMLPFVFFSILQGYWKKTKFKKQRHKVWAIVLFFLWFIFVPNSAYLITDVRHLIDYCPREAWASVCVSGVWQIMFFYVYSIFGWVFFVIFLQQMRRLVGDIFTPRLAKIMTLVMIPLISLGVLFGLIERFNSWDVFFHPLAIFQNLLRYMTSWEYFRNFIVFSFGFYVLYFFGDYLFCGIAERKSAKNRHK